MSPQGCDAEGAHNLIQDGSTDGAHQYVWDYRNRLIEVRERQSGEWVAVGAYKYDARNRRVLKDVTNKGDLNGATRFLWGGSSAWQCLEEREASGNLVARYTYSPGYIDAVAVQERDLTGDGDFLDAGEVVYYHSNTLASVMALTDASENVVERYRYDAYGAATVLEPDGSADADGISDVENPYLYTGRRLDLESGLLQYRNRYMSPSLGRFISRDPEGYADSYGLYAYVAGRPTIAQDPMGFKTEVTGSYIVGVDPQIELTCYLFSGITAYPEGAVGPYSYRYCRAKGPFGGGPGGGTGDGTGGGSGGGGGNGGGTGGGGGGGRGGDGGVIPDPIHSPGPGPILGPGDPGGGAGGGGGTGPCNGAPQPPPQEGPLVAHDVFLALDKRYAGGNYHWGHSHCVTFCMIANLSTYTDAWVCEMMKENLDYLQCKYGHNRAACYSAKQPSDYAANAAGMAMKELGPCRCVSSYQHPDWPACFDACVDSCEGMGWGADHRATEPGAMGAARGLTKEEHGYYDFRWWKKRKAEGKPY